MRELRPVEKTRRDGVVQTYNERGKPRSSRADRTAGRETTTELDRRMYGERMRAVAPDITDADVGRLHGHVPARDAERGLRNGRSVDEIVEAYQEHAPRSATGERLDLSGRAAVASSKFRPRTPAMKLAAAVEQFASMNFGRKEQ